MSIHIVLLSQWSTLCIDLVSISTGLFKGFSSLDGITVFASCEVRRIFTMKTGPLVTDEGKTPQVSAIFIILIKYIICIFGIFGVAVLYVPIDNVQPVLANLKIHL